MPAEDKEKTAEKKSKNDAKVAEKKASKKISKKATDEKKDSKSNGTKTQKEKSIKSKNTKKSATKTKKDTSTSKKTSLKDEKDITIKRTRKKSKDSEITQKLSEADTIKASQIILEEIKEFNIRKNEEEKKLQEEKAAEENTNEDVIDLEDEEDATDEGDGNLEDIEGQIANQEKIENNASKELNQSNENIEAKNKEENKEAIVANNENENNKNPQEIIDSNNANNNLPTKKSNNNKIVEFSEEERKKLKEIHKELVTVKSKKDSRLKNKYSEILRNLLVAVIIAIYFMIIMIENTKLSVVREMTYLKTSSIICLICGIILFENAYYKDKEKLFLNAVEITSLGVCTLYLLNLLVKQSDKFNLCIAIMVATFLVYYLIKSIFIRVKKEEKTENNQNT